MRTIAELARVSNLPTVWTNLLTGLCVGWLAASNAGLPIPDLSDVQLINDNSFVTALVLLCIFGSCFYTAGMILNDVIDATTDQTIAAHRPIPSGRINPSAALMLSLILFAMGSAALWPFAPHRFQLYLLAGLLLFAIVAYNLLHHHSPWAVLFMGACRALLILIGAAAFGVTGSTLWVSAGPFAASLFLYTVGITVIARREHNPASPGDGLHPFRGLLMLPIAFFPLLFHWPVKPPPIHLLLAASLIAVWLIGSALQLHGRQPKVKRAVTSWIAGMCLLDVWFITLIGRPLLAAIAAACFALTLLAQRKIAGT